MTNHIHLVAVPKDEHSLGHGLRDTHTVYAMYDLGAKSHYAASACDAPTVVLAWQFFPFRVSTKEKIRL